MRSKFKTGDDVEVIRYGHLIWTRYKDSVGFPIFIEGKGTAWFDMNPELVGQVGTVSKVTNTQGCFQYSLEGIKGKKAWFNEGQLKKVEMAK